MADTDPAGLVTQRALVPTERELMLGATVRAADVVVAPVVAPAARRPLARVVRESLAELNPRALGGPIAPLILLAFTRLFTQWDDAALAILLPEMRAEFAFSLEFLLALGSLLGVVTILLSPAMGYLADRVKRVWMLRIGGLLANGGSILQGLAPGLPQLVAGRVVSGSGGALQAPAAFPLLTDYYPSRSRARAFAFLGLAGGIGALLAPLVAGNLGHYFGWRFALVSVGVLATAVTLVLFLLREPIRGYQDRLEMGATEEVAAREQAPVSWSEGWRAARSISTLRRIWYATPFLQVAVLGINIFLPLYYASEFGLGPRERGYIFTANGALALVGVLVAGPLADRLLAYKPGRVMAILGGLLALYAGVILVLAVSPALWVSVAVGLPLSVGFVAILPALNTLISLVVPARIRGLGLQTIAPWQLIGMVALPFIGLAADSWGVRQGLLVFVPLFALGAVILGTSSLGVDRDIRAARAASMADEEARQARARGRSKMVICRDVDVTYDGVQVLFNVDFDVEQGDLVALVGTNGAGKSTLLRAIAGVQEASNGAIFLDGRDITHVPPHENAANGIVMVPGGQAIFPTLTVEENLRTAAWMYRDDAEYVAAGTERVLGMFPVLRERLHEAAGNMSGGEQQMLALAQAFLMRPRLLMIDELSLGLAPQVVRQLLETVRQIHAQGTTIVLVEQSLNVALTIAERAVFMEKGEIRFDGPTAELLGRPELVRAVFLGARASGSPGVAAGRRPKASERHERVLHVRDVSVGFGGVRALHRVNLTVGAGEVVGVIGANGAGKTTLFDVVCGFVTPDEGSVFLEAADVTALAPHARAKLGLGRSFQNVRLFGSMTVRENVAVALERHVSARNPALAAVWAPAVRRAERRAYRRVDSLIDLLGLGAYADKFASELSTGTRRTVDIACIMAAGPRVLLLDEPSSGLAQAETEALGPLLLRLVRDTGCALLVIEHDVPLVASIADELMAMELGEVIATGPPAEVVEDPRVLASYLTAPEELLARSGAGAESGRRRGRG